MDLEGNLSTTIVKKPVAPSTSRSNNGQQPTQDVGREAGPYRIRVKRIKQEQPISERLDEDGPIQISNSEVVTPFFLLNLSSYVTRVTMDNSGENSGLSYHLASRVDTSSAAPVQVLMNKLKQGGFANFNQLGKAFQVMIQAQAEYRKIFARSETIDLPEFTKFSFSSEYPQIAELRLCTLESCADYPVVRIALNKKLLTCITSDCESDAFASVHLGVKDLFKFMSQEEWIDYLEKTFEAYRENSQEGIRHEYPKRFIKQVTISFPSGESKLTDIWAQCVCYSNATVQYYTFYPVETDQYEEEKAGTTENYVGSEKTPQNEQELVQEEKQHMLDKRNQALEFLSKMYNTSSTKAESMAISNPTSRGASPERAEQGEWKPPSLPNEFK